MCHSVLQLRPWAIAILLFLVSLASNATAAASTAAPYVEIGDVSVLEGDSGTTPVVFTLTLSEAMTTPVTVSCYTGSGSAGWWEPDYYDIYSSVTFAPGETTKTVTVRVVGDTRAENDEYFYLYGYSLLPVYSGMATIRNDDKPAIVSVEDIAVTETDGTSIVTITLQSTKTPYGEVFYTLTPGTAHAGSDYKPMGGWLNFYGISSQTIEVTIAGDDVPEPNEEFFVDLYGYGVALERTRATIKVVNDDVGAGPAHQRIAVGESATFVVELGAPVTEETIVTLAATGGGITVPDSITLHTGERTASFDAQAVDEGSARIEVTLPASFGSASEAVTTATYVARSLVFTPGELSLYAGQTTTVSASLSPPSDRPLTVTLESKSDTVELPRTIVIPAGGSVSFDVYAVREGPIVVHATADGHDTSGLFGHVGDTPATPAILRIGPPTGPAAGGTTVDVNGVHFRDDCTVLFDGVPAAGVHFVNELQLIVTTPPHAAGTVDVQLSCGSASWSFTNGFTYIEGAPEIAGVVPSFGNVAGGTEVRIAGVNFRGSCWPFFGGVAAPRTIVESATSIAATVPPHADGTVDVTLQCSGAQALRAAAFHYTGAPEPLATIDSVDPLAGSPGQPVTLTGLRFRTTDRVTFGLTDAPILSTRGGEQVVRVPELPPGATSVTLTDANGHLTTTGPIFRVLESVPPFITAIAPAAVAPGAELRLDGRGFRPGYVFRIAGRIATIAALQYTSVVVRLDRAAMRGEHNVEIYNAAGNLAGIGPRVHVLAAGVTIHGLDTACATTEGGSQVTITGSGFAPGAIIRFNTVAATAITVVDEATIRVTVPPGEAGPAVLHVLNPDGSTAQLTGSFTYVSPFDPNGRCTGGGH